MKRLIYLIYAVFFLLMAATFYVAYHVYDGLVEEGYYSKAVNYFKEKEIEEGVRVEVPTNLREGNNRVYIKLTENGMPLTNGKTVLKVVGMKESEGERVFHLKETSPGVFTAVVTAEKRGRLIFKMRWSDGRREIERRWFVEVK